MSNLPQLSTCSYAAFRPEIGTPVRITLGSPRTPEPTGREHWLYVAVLAPRGWYFRAKPEKFDACYVAQLDRLAADIDAKLTDLAARFGPLSLLCFERKIRGPQDCHRRLFAEWWTRRTGEDVPELDSAKPRVEKGSAPA